MPPDPPTNQIYWLKWYIKIQSLHPPSASKGNNKFEILLVKIFSLKQKTNQKLPATLKKPIFFSSRKKLHVPSDYNF